MNTKTTRLPVDIIEAAEEAGRVQHRSAAKQLLAEARLNTAFVNADLIAAQRWPEDPEITPPRAWNGPLLWGHVFAISPVRFIDPAIQRPLNF